ncbi:TIGR02265 family protein [Vitiosangium sp. GDMCC 1.1324]|uniref:TIGR02265 family protein n=1 Tax=Vitiosangium sp. (strain GDMCC 1.1324) TaxID=2138576 RepID=UPI000D3B61CE|nr:TIGR02265 family protein [Vitiosangium sp. GDMCC 1.1324]PTL79743.1 TIGR02265 family protein [Vitiosangium sp. GDMCC 1.1324]
MSGISGEWSTVRSEAEQELEQRLSLATPDDTMRGMFFRSVREAVHVLKGDAAVEACLEEGGDVRSFVDFFAYPTGDFLRVLRRSAWVLSGAIGGFEETMRVLGHLGTAAFLGGLAGNVMHVLFTGTPRRVMENLPMAYKVMMPTGGGLSVVWLGYTHCRVLFTRDFLPRAYVEGSLEANLKKAGARSLRIAGRLTGALSSEYDVSWEA